jgi:uroporphyrinogen decarboxylase
MLTPQGYEVVYDKANSLVARSDGRDYYIGHSPWGNVRLYPVDHTEDGLAEAAFIRVRDALKDRAEWDAIKGDFRPDVDVRYGEDKTPGRWARRVAQWKTAEHPLILQGPSLVGDLVLNLGLDNYAVKLYDDREMIAQVMDARVDLAIRILDKAVREVDFDFLFIWEDMAFRNGPMVGPAIFEELIVPRYRRLTDWYRSRGGQIVALDSDGDVRKLIPGWIKGGITHLWPLEPFAGMDVVAVRRQYGQALSLRGGIDKFVVAKGKEAIDRELDRIWPVVQDGGYIPHLDHMLPHAPFENYCYYMDRKKQMLGKR